MGEQYAKALVIARGEWRIEITRGYIKISENVQTDARSMMLKDAEWAELVAGVECAHRQFEQVAEFVHLPAEEESDDDRA